MVIQHPAICSGPQGTHHTPHHTRHDAHVMCVSGPRNVRPTPSWRQLLTPELELYVKLVLVFVRLRQTRNHAVDHLTRCRGRRQAHRVVRAVAAAERRGRGECGRCRRQDYILYREFDSLEEHFHQRVFMAQVWMSSGQNTTRELAPACQCSARPRTYRRALERTFPSFSSAPPGL